MSDPSDPSCSTNRKWTCEYCTYENFPASRRCTVCRNLRQPIVISYDDRHGEEQDIYKMAPQVVTSQRISANQDASNSRHIDQYESQQQITCQTNTEACLENTVIDSPSTGAPVTNKWSCQACTYLNWPRANKCTQCLTPRPRAISVVTRDINQPLSININTGSKNSLTGSNNSLSGSGKTSPSGNSANFSPVTNSLGRADSRNNSPSSSTPLPRSARATGSKKSSPPVLSLTSTATPPDIAKAINNDRNRAIVAATSSTNTRPVSLLVSTGKWGCTVCTYENWPRSTKCVMCGTRRTGQANLDSSVSHQAPSTSENTSIECNALISGDNEIDSSEHSDRSKHIQYASGGYRGSNNSLKSNSRNSSGNSSPTNDIIGKIDVITNSRSSTCSPIPRNSPGNSPGDSSHENPIQRSSNSRHSSSGSNSSHSNQSQNSNRKSHRRSPPTIATGAVANRGGGSRQVGDGGEGSSPFCVATRIEEIATGNQGELRSERSEYNKDVGDEKNSQSACSATARGSPLAPHNRPSAPQRDSDWLWLQACRSVVQGDFTSVEAFLASGGEVGRQLTLEECALLNRPSAYQVGHTLVILALRFGREDLLAALLAAADAVKKAKKRVPCHAAPGVASELLRLVSAAIRQRKGDFPCYFLTDLATFALPADIDDLPQPIRKQLFAELLDQNVQKELEEDEQVINWSLELTSPRLGSRLYALWNRTAGDCLLDSVLQATYGIFDRDNTLRRAMADSLLEGQNMFYPCWKESELQQAESMQYSLEEAQWQQDWQFLLNLASQSGSSLEQIHIWALAHILRRPIIVYGIKYVKSFRGENLGFARFQGVYLPLLWEQSFCFKTPIALGYTRGHFSALVAMESPFADEDILQAGAGAGARPLSPSSFVSGHYSLLGGETEDCGGRQVAYLPLVDYEGKLLPIHFLPPAETGREEAVLRTWLSCCVTEGGLLVAQQNIGKRPLLVRQMTDEWMERYRRLSHMMHHQQQTAGAQAPYFHPSSRAHRGHGGHSDRSRRSAPRSPPVITTGHDRILPTNTATSTANTTNTSLSPRVNTNSSALPITQHIMPTSTIMTSPNIMTSQLEQHNSSDEGEGEGW